MIDRWLSNLLTGWLTGRVAGWLSDLLTGWISRKKKKRRKVEAVLILFWWRRLMCWDDRKVDSVTDWLTENVTSLLGPFHGRCLRITADSLKVVLQLANQRRNCGEVDCWTKRLVCIYSDTCEFAPFFSVVLLLFTSRNLVHPHNAAG